MHVLCANLSICVTLSSNPTFNAFCRERSDRTRITDFKSKSVAFYLTDQSLAERSGHDVAPTLRRYILKLEDASDRLIFKEAYARASRYNQAVFEEKNRNGSVPSQSTEGEDNVPSTEGGGGGDDSEDSESTENENDVSSTQGEEGGDESEDSIDRRLAGIGESQADDLFNKNRRFG